MTAPKKRKPVHNVNTGPAPFDGELDLDFAEIAPVSTDTPEPDDAPLATVIPFRRPA